MFEYKRIFLGVVLLLVLCFTADGQTQRLFKGGVIIGGNASQMDGDEAIGYNLLGLRLGLRAAMALQDKMEISMDIVYSQRGSKTTTSDYITYPFQFRLNYLEVPVLFHYGDWDAKDVDGNTYYKMVFSGGLSYSRLFSSDVDETFVHAATLGKSAFLNTLAKDDIGWVLGVDFNFTSHWGLEARFVKSFNLLFDHDKYAPTTDLNSLRGYFFCMQGVYVF
jgi:hypothetical protein